MANTLEPQNQPKHHAAKSKLVALLRRRKILMGLIEGKTRQQIGVEVGLNPKTAQSQISKIIQEPHTQTTFRVLLDAAVSDNELALKYKQLLESTKVISARVVGSDGGIMTRYFIEVADCAVQLKCADSISKLKGYMNDKSDVNFNLSVLSYSYKR